MKAFLNKKNLYLFFLLYTIITICVSIYNLLNGNVYDNLGYYHELYRAVFVMFIIALLDFIRNFRLKNSLISFLEQLIPLILCLSLFGLIMYLKGDISLDEIKKYLLYALALILGIILSSGLYQSLKSYLMMMFKGKKKYFSFMSLLLIIIILIPFVIYHYFNINDSWLMFVYHSWWYIASFVLLGLVLIALLLSTRLKDEISFINIIFIVFYYIAWLVLIFVNKEENLYALQIVQGLLCCLLLTYQMTNNFKHCIPFTLISYILSFIGAMYHFN